MLPIYHRNPGETIKWFIVLLFFVSVHLTTVIALFTVSVLVSVALMLLICQQLFTDSLQTLNNVSIYLKSCILWQALICVLPLMGKLSGYQQSSKLALFFVFTEKESEMQLMRLNQNNKVVVCQTGTICQKMLKWCVALRRSVMFKKKLRHDHLKV